MGHLGGQLAAATQQSLRISIRERESMKSWSAASWDSFFPNVRPNSIREFRRGRPHPLPASTWAVLGGINSRHINFPSLDCVVQGSTMLGRRLRNSQWTEENAYTLSPYASRKHDNTSVPSEGMLVQARWPWWRLPWLYKHLPGGLFTLGGHMSVVRTDVGQPA